MRSCEDRVEGSLQASGLRRHGKGRSDHLRDTDDDRETNRGTREATLDGKGIRANIGNRSGARGGVCLIA